MTGDALEAEAVRGQPIPGYKDSAIVNLLGSTDKPKADALKAVRVIDYDETTTGPVPACSRVIHQPVIFVTRVEYANLFHTTTGESGSKSPPNLLICI